MPKRKPLQGQWLKKNEREIFLKEELAILGLETISAKAGLDKTLRKQNL
ncbi:MAG: hypothetical protein JRJ57_06575 [Deltaproteobacteria bacterium]|nr:hypothetical protein [Deltaproteobacteria bacterium]